MRRILVLGHGEIAADQADGDCQGCEQCQWSSILRCLQDLTEPDLGLAWHGLGGHKRKLLAQDVHAVLLLAKVGTQRAQDDRASARPLYHGLISSYRGLASSPFVMC